MLHYVFGSLKRCDVNYHADRKAAGYLEYEKARVRWFLSVDETDLPEEAKNAGQRTFRAISVDGELIEFSGGFTDLHTVSYEHILNGGGFGLEEARKSIEIVSEIRNQEVAQSRLEY